VSDALADRFESQGREWRDPLQIVSQWSDVAAADAGDLQAEATGAWWDVLAATGTTLIVSREYEHLLLALNATRRPRVSYLRLPHPSGVAFAPDEDRLYVASTRNPNQLYAFSPLAGMLERADVAEHAAPIRALLPERTWYLPGCSYIHDLAVIGGTLHANAVGQNVVLAIADGRARPVWWPAALERDGRPRTECNYIQLNSIAAGADLAGSYFSASGERPGELRPGHERYPVDGRGVIYSGATREPVVRGLTRPHSARLHQGSVWVDNSGYGEVGVARDGHFDVVTRLPGWTRGLGFAGGIAFVGTSRVIPRFRQYAPGLDVDRSVCGVHAVDLAGGQVLGSLLFPAGNQIFAIEPVPASWTPGFPFDETSTSELGPALFYAYRLAGDTS